MKKFAIFIVTFLFIFGPVFRPVGNWFDLIFITSLALSFYGFFFQKIQPPKLWYPFLILFPIYIYGALLILLTPDYQTSDFVRAFLKPLRIIVTVYGGYVLVQNYGRIQLNEIKVIEYIYYVISIHACIMTLQLIFPEFKDFVYDYTSTGVFRSSYDYDFRMGGLSGGSGSAVLSAVQSIGVLLSPYVIKGKEKKTKILLFLMLLLIITSILISGRTGIWIILMFLPLILIFSTNSKDIKIGRILVKVLTIFVSIALIIVLFDYIEPQSPLYYAFRRSLDTFLAFKQEGTFEDSTFTILLSHLKLPTETSVWLFGDGAHLTNIQFNRILDADNGYIRDLWSYGIFGISIVLFPAIYILLKCIPIKENRNKYLVIILTCVMLIMHAKEQFVYVRMFLSIYSLIVFSVFYKVKIHDQSNFKSYFIRLKKS